MICQQNTSLCQHTVVLSQHTMVPFNHTVAGSEHSSHADPSYTLSDDASVVARHMKAAVLCCAVQPGHAWLSQHYKWALDRVFLEQGHSHVIIVEDDMLFSPDFLHFFEATAVLLERDPSLWCVSTWNDNGLKSYDWDPMRMVWPLLLCASACVCGAAVPGCGCFYQWPAVGAVKVSKSFEAFVHAVRIHTDAFRISRHCNKHSISSVASNW